MAKVSKKGKKTEVNPDKTGVYATEMKKMLDRLEKSPVLKKMFDGRVLDNLAVIADANILRIEDASPNMVSKKDEKAFLKALETAAGGA